MVSAALACERDAPSGDASTTIEARARNPEERQSAPAPLDASKRRRTTDAGTPPTGPCEEPSGYVKPNAGGCTAAESWTCGTSPYSVTCFCPAESCVCQDKTTDYEITTAVVCGGCKVIHNIDALATLCGFPRPAR